MSSNRDSLIRRAQPALGPTLRAPGFVKLMLEGRAPWEYAALLAAMPLLKRMPAGDGHPVIVFPGLAAGDISTRPLRRFLEERGYKPYAWKLGANFGPRAGVIDRCTSLVDEVWNRHQQPVSLIGWSLGGIYAREMALRRTECVRCVITLGTPFTGHPRATNAWRLYEWLSGLKVHDPAWADRIRETPDVPTTSIYSRSDGIVAWECSLNPLAPHTENIELPASHLGLGVNPLTYLVISDRLAQTPAHWHRFEPRGLTQWLIRTGDASRAA